MFEAWHQRGGQLPDRLSVLSAAQEDKQVQFRVESEYVVLAKGLLENRGCLLDDRRYRFDLTASDQ
ncbi:MAG: hypothetical protein JNL68_13690 [Burkholderiales bacterium]|nr:hypothetical protein [Burkholderiales bacterium]